MTTTMPEPIVADDCVRSVVDMDTDRVRGIITGLAARWDQPYRVSDDGGQTWYEEVWRHGAATKSIRERKMFELRLDHGDSDRLGGVEFYERTDALRFEARVEDDQEAVRQAIADGQLGPVSVRYTKVKREALRSDRQLLTEVKLRELSLVSPGQRAQYPDAVIESMRAHDPAHIAAAQAVLQRRRDLQVEAKRAMEAARGLLS